MLPPVLPPEYAPLPPDDPETGGVTTGFVTTGAVGAAGAAGAAGEVAALTGAGAAGAVFATEAPEPASVGLPADSPVGSAVGSAVASVVGAFAADKSWGARDGAVPLGARTSLAWAITPGIAEERASELTAMAPPAVAITPKMESAVTSCDFMFSEYKRLGKGGVDEHPRNVQDFVVCRCNENCESCTGTIVSCAYS